MSRCVPVKTDDQLDLQALKGMISPDRRAAASGAVEEFLLGCIYEKGLGTAEDLAGYQKPDRNFWLT